MCGVTGIVARRDRQVQPLLQGLVRAVSHRGPDGQGALLRDAGQWTVGLGHTRLAILDLSSAGAQPMGLQDKGFWISYNGEVYNFRDLRKELEALGYRFRSQTDTEVMLRAYEAWGVDAFRRFRGMFAFALWDEPARKLHLVRGHLGIKPMYYYMSGDIFLFGSEVRAILGTGLVSRRLDSSGVASYLRYGSVQAPRTIVQGIRSLLPGTYLTLDLRDGALRTEERNYAEVLSGKTQVDASKSRGEAVARLGELLQDSVTAHLVSDVPVGVFLSGGIDSSSIVALLSKTQGAQKPKTFTVSFKEAEFSEGERAKLLARTFGTEHQEIVLSETDALHLLPSAIMAMDQPTVDGINTYVISKTVRDTGIKVALSGLGGDELFAGYPSFRRALRMRAIARIPRPIRSAVSNIGAALAGRSPPRRKRWEMFASDGAPQTVYDISRSLFSSSEVAALAPWLPRDVDLGPSVAASVPVAFANDVVNAVSYCETAGYMANTLLRDTDFMSMAHALEVRTPFVDAVVIPYVLSLPGEWKVQSGRPKPLLLDALGGALPEEIWRRPKMGFTLPFSQWMKSALEPELSKQLLGGEQALALAQACLAPSAVEQVWNDFRGNPRGEGWSRPWALYVLARWCQVNNVAC